MVQYNKPSPAAPGTSEDNNMATGERTFSTSGREVKKFESKPITPGEYELKMNSDWEQRVADGEGKLPYLNGSFEVFNTAGEDGGKNRRVYHRFFLDLSPGKDGTPMVDRGNQLTGFAKGMGVELKNVPILSKQKMNKEGELVPADLLSPQGVLKWLKSNDGAVVKARIKTEKNPEYGDKSVVDYFIETEESLAEEEMEVADEEVIEDPEDEEQPEPKKTPAKKVQKVASKHGKR